MIGCALTIEQTCEQAFRRHQAGKVREPMHRQLLSVRPNPNILNNLGDALAEQGRKDEPSNAT